MRSLVVVGFVAGCGRRLPSIGRWKVWKARERSRSRFGWLLRARANPCAAPSCWEIYRSSSQVQGLVVAVVVVDWLERKVGRWEIGERKKKKITSAETEMSLQEGNTNVPRASHRETRKKEKTRPREGGWRGGEKQRVQ